MNNADQAIEELYRAFQQIPKPKGISYCPCCIDESKINKLLNTELRELSVDDLSTYTFSLLNTIGEIEDFQYFLPRIFEIVLANEFGYVDHEVIFEKLKLGDWKNWEIDLRSAVEKFVLFAWTSELEKQEPKIDTILCSIGQCEPDLTKYLDLVRPNQAFIDFIERNNEELAKNRLSNSFWEKCPEQMMQVVHWLKSEKAQEMICDAYYR